MPLETRATPVVEEVRSPPRSRRCRGTRPDSETCQEAGPLPPLPHAQYLSYPLLRWRPHVQVQRGQEEAQPIQPQWVERQQPQARAQSEVLKKPVVVTCFH